VRFASLEAFGVHPDLLAAWQSGLGPELLPIQEKAVRAGVLDGRSVLAVAPASAGKTVIAEMAIGQAVMGRGRAWYLSPTRALTEQKHAELSARFGPLGVRTVITTGQHTAGDADLERGDFDLAVAVPEKARAMMAKNPALAAGARLVVVDELELLADPERGPALEMLLADVMGLGGCVQVVALTATAANSTDLAQWLGAEVVEDRNRPVELRLGVVTDGVFAYREHNTGGRGEEALEYEPLEGGPSSHLAGLALALARAGEQTMVFVRDKTSANNLAAALAEEAGLPPARGLMERLDECEATAAVSFLRRLAEAGVSFHHGDLRAKERLAVEEAVASGEARLLVATSTLAAGVNLPTRNVVIDPAQWHGAMAEGARPALRPLPLADFVAMAGRAGRLGYDEPFGRAMMMATTPMQRDALMAGYVDAEPPVIVPALVGLSAMDRAVALGMSALAAQGGLGAAWRGSLSARIGGLDEQRAWRAGAEGLRAAGLLDGEGRPTPALRAAAGGSMDAASLIHMQRFAAAGPRDADWLDLLAAAAAAPQMARMPLPIGRAELRERDYVTELLAWGEERGAGGDVMREMLRDPGVALMDRQRAAKLALVLLQWASSLSVVEVEEAVRLTAGRMEGLAGGAGWLMDVGAGMAAARGWPKVAVQRLGDAARAVRLGLPVADRAAGWAAVDETEEAGEVAKVRRAPPPATRPRPPAAAPQEDKPRATHAGPAALLLDERTPDRAIARGKVVKLTRVEFRLLWRLAQEPGACVSYYHLVCAMFGAEEYEGAHQVYSHASRVRGKLAAAVGKDGGGWVATVPREGVKLDLEASMVARVERPGAPPLDSELPTVGLRPTPRRGRGPLTPRDQKAVA
jgi:helicase